MLPAIAHGVWSETLGGVYPLLVGGVASDAFEGGMGGVTADAGGVVLWVCVDAGGRGCSSTPWIWRPAPQGVRGDGH
jgi:hypothetical protein